MSMIECSFFAFVFVPISDVDALQPFISKDPIVQKIWTLDAQLSSKL